MSASLTFDSVAAATPEGDLLFDELTLSIGAERVGLVGRNGSGKSTLIAIAAGNSPPTAGIVTRRGRIGLLEQNWPEHLSVADAMGIAPALATLERITAGKGCEADFETADWTLETRVASAFGQLGLSAIALERPIASLSGGECSRVGIARLLVEEPDLLLLDEPTNNLDAAGRSAIGTLLANWRGGALVASHDRTLLETMDRIVELTPIRIRIVGGGWSAFAAQREAERARFQAEMDRADAALGTARRAAQQQREAQDRRDKAGYSSAMKGGEPRIVLGARQRRAEESHGRVHRLGEQLITDAAMRVKQARDTVEILSPLKIILPPSGLPMGSQVLAVEAARVAAGTRILGPWSLRLVGPERVAIAGNNGAGKTTLLKLAAGVIDPLSGSVKRIGAPIVMLDQHAAILCSQATVLDNFHRLNPGLPGNAAYAACARFAFRNRDALRIVGTLSGGERLRAALACTMAGDCPPQLLILDEPTNHLDIDAIDSLAQALGAYDGALLVVSHDPAFLSAIGIERTQALEAR